MTGNRGNNGFTLVELVIGIALAALLSTGVTQLALAAGRSFRVQQSLGALQENARVAFDAIGAEINAAGFRHEPWSPDTEIPAIAPDTLDSASPTSDRLVLRRWSDINCFGNPNPVTDATGRPSHFFRESGFVVDGKGNLALTCRYGPDALQLTTQISNMGLVQNAEALQVVFAVDSDGDANADRWARAGNWQSEPGVRAVRLALLLATPEPITETAQQAIQVLDQVVQPSADGRMRRVFHATFDLRGRK
jgi:prepilin-type N-terminal cleavage/methylation domain-containing protein